MGTFRFLLKRLLQSALIHPSKDYDGVQKESHEDLIPNVARTVKSIHLIPTVNIMRVSCHLAVQQGQRKMCDTS